MNERGNSFVEAMLSLMIMLLIFGTLLPLFQTLNEKKITMEKRYHAHRVAYYVVVKQLMSDKPASGTMTYDGERYHWAGDRQRMCVSYEVFREQQQVCFEATK
jgi:hypothetical protein